MGNYRGQVKAPRRLGMNPSLELRPGIYNHWEKLRARGFTKLPCAVVLGAPPCVTFASVQKLPETVDELYVAGALVGSPINVVKAQDGRSPGAGRGRDRDRGLHRHRISRARGAVRRIPRPRQPAGIQRLYGRDLHHAAPRRHSHLDHLPGDAERIEPDQAHRHGAAVPQLPAQHARHQGHQARLDARAADQHPQGDRAWWSSATCQTDGALARALRRRDPAPRRRQIRHRDQRRHRSGERRRAAVGDVLPGQSDARHARAAASRPGPRPAQQAQRRRGRLGADRRHAQGEFPADLAAQARIHGERQEDLGGARPAQAQAGSALVRLFARRMVRRARRRRGARHARRLFRHRQGTRQAPPQGRADEHGSAQREGAILHPIKFSTPRITT